jgi:hypothetical protein
MAANNEVGLGGTRSGAQRYGNRFDSPYLQETSELFESTRGGRASSPTTLSAADVIKRRTLSSTIDELPKLSEQLGAFFKSADSALRSSPQDIDHILRCYSTLPTLLQSLVAVVEGLPTPSPARDPAIGEAFLGVAQAQWATLDKNDPKSWFSSVAGAYKPTEEQMDPYTEPMWLTPLKTFVDFQVDATKLPSREYYLDQSAIIAPRLAEANKAIEETKERYDSIRRGNEASIAKGRPAPFAAQEQMAKSKYDQAIQQKAELLSHVSDLFPPQLTEALCRFTIVATPKEQVLRDLIKTAASMETVLVAALIARKKAPEQAIFLACPRLKASGELSSVAFQIPQDQLSRLGKDDQRLTDLIKTITNYRDVLSQCMTLLQEMPEHARKYLSAPLSTVSAKWVDALTRLLASDSPELRSSVAEMIGRPVVTDQSRGTWGYVLESPENYPLVSSLISGYLGSNAGPERQSYRAGLESAPSIARGALGLLNTIQGHLDAKRFGRLAKLLNEQVVTLAANGDTATRLVLLASLDYLVSNNSIRIALRHQLPNLEDAKKIGEALSEKHENLSEKVSQIVGRIVRGLSQSLEDYYMEGNGGELREAIENYRYFLANRDCLQGAPANETIRSAIIVYGPPGVGKSFFVNCLKNELNVEQFSLSPSAKDEGEDRLDYTKKIIEKVKKYGKPCILLIDEAEATAVDRRIPTITSEDRAITNYLLMETDELRRNYPHIFIVFATNYIKQVDPAIRRPGRADLPYEMKPPGEAGRAALIRGALLQHGIDLELDDDQVAELVQLSEGFTPGRIKLAILENHRVTIPRKRLLDPDVEFSYEIVKNAFLAEQQRLARDNALGVAGDLV